jgi:aryl-alcohol dehydrogenase-like predicted oxidoreductase
VALNWLITYSGDIVVTIPGATKVHQAEQNAGAMKFALAPDELARLDEISNNLK